MTLKVKLTEKGLFVNKYKCNNITIEQTKDGYEGIMFNIEGISKTIPKLNRFGKQDKDGMGNLLFTILRLKKKIKSKDLDYSGIPLSKGRLGNHAMNTKLDYVNLYLLD